MDCLFCVNCVLFRQGVADVAWWERSAYFKSIAEPDLTPFVFYTDETLREAVRRLHAAKGDVTKTDFDQLQQQYGWGYVKEDLLLDEHIRLDAISITMVDWSHTYIANGIADVEFGEFMHTMRKTQTTYKELGSYSSSWSYPRLYASLDHLFEHKKTVAHLKNRNFGCSASDFLTLLPVLVCYIARVSAIRDTGMAAYIDSMLAVLSVAEVLQAVKRRMATPQQLKDRILEHMRLFLAAYGAEAIRPKHHFALHLPQMFERIGTLLGTLTNERRHRVVKRYTKDRRCLKRWELGSLEEITCHAVWELTQPILRAGQLDPVAPRARSVALLNEMFPDGARQGCELTLSNRVKATHGTVITNDCVFFEDPDNSSRAVGELLMNVGLGDVQLSILSRWRAIGASTDQRLRDFAMEDDVIVVPSGCLVCSCTHRQDVVGATSFVYIPWEFWN